MSGLDDDDILDSDALGGEAVAVEEDEIDDGYGVKDGDEELKKGRQGARAA